MTDDRKLFENLVLDGAQCGLSWSTILRRRAAYTAAFKNWDIDAVAAMVCILESVNIFESFLVGTPMFAHLFTQSLDVLDELTVLSSMF